MRAYLRSILKIRKLIICILQVENNEQHLLQEKFTYPAKIQKSFEAAETAIKMYYFIIVIRHTETCDFSRKIK